MKNLPFRIKVYHKIIFPFLLIIILGILTTLPYGVTITHKLNMEKTDQKLASVAQVTANYINGRLDQLLADTRSLLEDTKEALSQEDSKNLTSHFLEAKTRPGISFISAYDAGTRQFLSLGPVEIMAGQDLSEIMTQVKMGIHRKALITTPEDFVLLAAVPNYAATNEMKGLLMAGFILDQSSMLPLKQLVDHDVALVPVSGGRIISSDPLLADFLEGAAVNQAAETTRYLDFSMNGEPYRAAVTGLRIYSKTEALVCVAAPMGKVIAFRNRLLTYMLSMAMIGTLAVLIVGLRIVRSINRPIRRLLALTETVSEGNLDVQIEEVTGDELGDLTLSFNHMVVRLRENIAEVQSGKDQITQYALSLEEYSIQIQREKKETEAILQNMRDGLIMTDHQGAVSAINPVAMEIIGCTPESALGEQIVKVLSPWLDLLADPEPFRRALNFSEDDMREEKIFESTVQEPSRTIYRISVYPVFGANEILMGWIITWHNITVEKETEEMKNNFLSTISHELRTPLTSIKGSLNLFLDGNLGLLSQDQKEFLMIADRNCARLKDLVDNLLDLARMEAGQLTIKATEFDLIQLVKKSLADIRSLGESRQMEILWSTDLKEAPILGDPERILQLVNNLVNNAIKFSPEGSRVSVSLEGLSVSESSPLPDRGKISSGDYFRVSVSDQGQGIPADQIDRIFDKFYQVDMSLTRVAGGSGLGLSIARSVIEDHGGDIWAENRPGGGSRFIFILPRHSSVKKAGIAEHR